MAAKVNISRKSVGSSDRRPMLFSRHSNICRFESFGPKSKLEAKYNLSGYTEF
jgi:hypothetical protein